jgi:hypothetical protein
MGSAAAAETLSAMAREDAAPLLAALNIEDASPIVLFMDEGDAEAVLTLIDPAQADLIRFGVNVDRDESILASVSADLQSGAISQSTGETLLSLTLNSVNTHIEELAQFANSQFSGAVATYGAYRPQKK